MHGQLWLRSRAASGVTTCLLSSFETCTRSLNGAPLPNAANVAHQSRTDHTLGATGEATVLPGDTELRDALHRTARSKFFSA